MNIKFALLCSLGFLTALLGLMLPRHVAAATYIVQPGDTLTQIALQFGTSVEAIVEANNIADPNLIIIGQVLEIPTGIGSDSFASPILAPTENLLVTDFDNCDDTNNLGGTMGPAYQPPDNWLAKSYVSETGHGCVVKLEYEIKDWGAFYLKLNGPDLTSFIENDGVLSFDIRADEPIPNGVKIEVKRFCPPLGVEVSCGELSVYYMTGITPEWQRRSVPLAGFGTVGWAATLSSWEGIEELVFTFEAHNSGNNGLVYLDNIAFVR
jgi:LysM repeat protein